VLAGEVNIAEGRLERKCKIKKKEVPMPRINIEDTLWSDTRFLRLCVKLGNEFQAIGALVLAFKTAQKHWCPAKGPIPPEEWEMAGLPEAIIEVGLAQRLEDGIYVCGAEAQFSWWFQRYEAGKRGGRPPLAKADVKRSVTPAKRAEPSSSSSSSSSISSSKELNTSTQIVKPQAELALVTAPPPMAPAIRPPKLKDPELGQKTAKLIAAYCEAFKKRYGSNPAVTGRIQGEMKALLGSVSLDRAMNLIQAYLQMDDEWFKKKHHDFTTFTQNLNKISVSLDQGRESGGINWDYVFGSDKAKVLP